MCFLLFFLFLVVAACFICDGGFASPQMRTAMSRMSKNMPGAEGGDPSLPGGGGMEQAPVAAEPGGNRATRRSGKKKAGKSSGSGGGGFGKK